MLPAALSPLLALPTTCAARAPPAAAVTIPVIASSGAGAPEHFSEVFHKTRAAAALAAGIFHRREVPISAVKAHLNSSGIPARTA